MNPILASSSLPHWIHSVHHDGSPLFLSDLYPRLGETVQIRLRASLNAPIRRVFLRTFPDGEQAFAMMDPGPVEAPVRWWTIELKIDQPVVHYRFILQADDGVWWYNAAGAQHYDPLDSADFQILADYQSPAWLHSAVFYQIFPDRFANGDPANDPQPGEYEFRGNRPHTYPWGTLPPENDFFSLVFYGGDLQGIRQKLDYLQDLGVNALYLTPVFTAYSNHKYDVADYKQVDPHFGGDQALIELRQALDARQMRYILDIVPNHCGYWHPWFQAARANPQTPEAEFFTFTRHPDQYASWLGVWTLPKLNYRSPELRRRMITAPDSVFRYWLQASFSADGWRIDVANMLARQGESQLGPQIARDIRQAVKETNPDAYLLGENFFDASLQLQGDQWDAVMNYSGFRKPLLYWLSGFKQGAWGLKEQIISPAPFSTAALVSTWRAHLGAIPWAVALQQFNLLNSHDTPRLRTAVGGSKPLQKLAAILLFTYPGVPCLYYGDEVGLQDLPRLNSRGTMPWDPSEWDHELLAFYKKLIHLRRSSSVLQTGSLQIMAIEEDTLAYLRQNEDGRILVIAQRSPQPRLPAALTVAHAGIQDGIRFEEFFSGQSLTVAGGILSLPEHPQGATIWIQK